MPVVPAITSRTASTPPARGMHRQTFWGLVEEHWHYHGLTMWTIAEKCYFSARAFELNPNTFLLPGA